MTNHTFQKRFTLLFSFIIGSVLFANAQYGNEWIIPTQKYVKIKVSAEGLYSIDYNQVVSANLTSGTINPNRFQLFNKGKQIPVLVSGDQISFGNTDKITFLGQPNDASLDKSLYTTSSDLPNSEISLFEDVNYYFLTYSETIDGLRYQTKTISSAGLSPENYVVYNSRLNLYNTYYPGAYILEQMSFSEFIAGEGYFGATYGKGQTVSHNLNTPFFAINSNLDTRLSYYVAGRSNSASGSRKGNHHLNLSLNNTTVAL